MRPLTSGRVPRRPGSTVGTSGVNPGEGRKFAQEVQSRKASNFTGVSRPKKSARKPLYGADRGSASLNNLQRHTTPAHLSTQEATGGSETALGNYGDRLRSSSSAATESPRNRKLKPNTSLSSVKRGVERTAENPLALAPLPPRPQTTRFKVRAKPAPTTHLQGLGARPQTTGSPGRVRWNTERAPADLLSRPQSVVQSPTRSPSRAVSRAQSSRAGSARVTRDRLGSAKTVTDSVPTLDSAHASSSTIATTTNTNATTTAGVAAGMPATAAGVTGHIPPKPRADISARHESPGHGLTPRGEEMASLKIPETIIPPEYHETEKLPVPGDIKRGQRVRFDEGEKVWVKTLFPPEYPSRREDVAILEDWIERVLWEEVYSKEGELEHIPEPDRDEVIRELQDKQEHIYMMSFRELVRQVSVHCVERGELLERLWKAYHARAETMIHHLSDNQDRLAQNVEAQMKGILRKKIEDHHVSMYRLKGQVEQKITKVLTDEGKQKAEMASKIKELQRHISTLSSALHIEARKKEEFRDKIAHMRKLLALPGAVGLMGMDQDIRVGTTEVKKTEAELTSILDEFVASMGEGTPFVADVDAMAPFQLDTHNKIEEACADILEEFEMSVDGLKDAPLGAVSEKRSELSQDLATRIELAVMEAVGEMGGDRVSPQVSRTPSVQRLDKESGSPFQPALEGIDDELSDDGSISVRDGKSAMHPGLRRLVTRKSSMFLDPDYTNPMASTEHDSEVDDDESSSLHLRQLFNDNLYVPPYILHEIHNRIDRISNLVAEDKKLKRYGPLAEVNSLLVEVERRCERLVLEEMELDNFEADDIHEMALGTKLTPKLSRNVSRLSASGHDNHDEIGEIVAHFWDDEGDYEPEEIDVEALKEEKAKKEKEAKEKEAEEAAKRYRAAQFASTLNSDDENYESNPIAGADIEGPLGYAESVIENLGYIADTPTQTIHFGGNWKLNYAVSMVDSGVETDLSMATMDVQAYELASLKKLDAEGGLGSKRGGSRNNLQMSSSDDDDNFRDEGARGGKGRSLVRSTYSQSSNRKASRRRKIKASFIPFSFQRLLSSQASQSTVRPNRSIKWVLKHISMLYSEKITNDKLDDQSGQPRQDLAPFVYDYHFNKYGLKPLAERNIVDFLYNVDQHKQSNPRVQMFARFCAMNDVEFLPLSCLNFYLDAVSSLRRIADDSNTAGKIFVRPADSEELHCHVMALQALDMIKEVFPEGSAEEVHDFGREILTKALGNSHYKTSTKVPLDHLLETLLSKWIGIYKRFRVDRTVVFAAADVDGDERLNLEEFTEIMRLLEPSKQKKQIQRMYKQELFAVGGEGGLSQSQFIRLLDRMNITEWNAAPEDFGVSDDVAMSMEYLKTTWDHIEPDVLTALEKLEQKSFRRANIIRKYLLGLKGMFRQEDIDIPVAWARAKIIRLGVGKIRGAKQARDRVKAAFSKVKNIARLFHSASAAVGTGKKKSKIGQVVSLPGHTSHTEEMDSGDNTPVNSGPVTRNPSRLSVSGSHDSGSVLEPSGHEGGLRREPSKVNVGMADDASLHSRPRSRQSSSNANSRPERRSISRGHSPQPVHLSPPQLGRDLSTSDSGL